jgi:hypothetical protein
VERSGSPGTHRRHVPSGRAGDDRSSHVVPAVPPHRASTGKKPITGNFGQHCGPLQRSRRAVRRGGWKWSQVSGTVQVPVNIHQFNGAFSVGYASLTHPTGGYGRRTLVVVEKLPDCHSEERSDEESAPSAEDFFDGDEKPAAESTYVQRAQGDSGLRPILFT